MFVFFFKQKTAYEMRISDWSSDVCSSDLILVPTLRCNLSCSYCQVSRVNADRSGFDWSEDTLAAVLACLDRLDTDRIKIEFPGGEPTLRLDLIAAVIVRCTRLADPQFVVLPTLHSLSAAHIALFHRAPVDLHPPNTEQIRLGH